MTSANNPADTCLTASGGGGGGGAYTSMQAATEHNDFTCFGADLDDVFAYNTAKIVRVRDRRLGIVRLIFILTILGYIIGDVFIVKRKFLDVETPVGTVSVSLKKPDKVTDVTHFPYCHRYDDEKVYGKPLQPYFQRTCRIVDAISLEGTPDAGDSFFVATRHSVKHQVRECAVDAEVCKRPWVEDRSDGDYHPPLKGAPKGSNDHPPDFNSTYYADVESYTLLIKHAMISQRLYRATGEAKFSRSNNGMTGKLVAKGGRVIREFGEKPDIVSVADLLDAAGVDLDTNFDKYETKRHSGIVVMVTISYTNKFDLEHPTYTMSAAQVDKAEYKVETVLDSIPPTRTPHNRTLSNRHGIKFVFLQTGQMARFDFQVALVQVVSAFALLSVATFTVELLMLYVLPQRKEYNAYKYEISKDFSDHRNEMATE